MISEQLFHLKSGMKMIPGWFPGTGLQKENPKSSALSWGWVQSYWRSFLIFLHTKQWREQPPSTWLADRLNIYLLDLQTYLQAVLVKHPVISPLQKKKNPFTK